MIARILTKIILLVFCMTVFAAERRPWNDPYPADDPNANTYYTSFTERPKHLDPARSYSSNEWVIINQIYEPPFQYHYLKRPYQLEPLTAVAMPEMTYYDAHEKVLASNASIEQIAYTVYRIKIKRGILYQPHPAFAQDESGAYRYHTLSVQELDEIDDINDFPQTGTRELTAEDYIYQIKRLADPEFTSPIFGMMAAYIVGLGDFEAVLKNFYQQTNEDWIDLRDRVLTGVTLIDKYTYEIKLKGVYPQFQYWLATPFFGPMPWEATRFFSQPGLIEKNITLDWYPIGTGPYMLKTNNPNQEIVLLKNPNFHGEQYPNEGESKDQKVGLLNNQGRSLPFIDKIQFVMEKESIPYWNKFLQGYYDTSGISSDSFDTALQSSANGGLTLTEDLVQKGIKLDTVVLPSTFYWGFNMEDPIVGGYSDQKKWLRQAISIAIDLEEYIEIFMNGRGIAAQGPIPPSIFGYQAGEKGINPYIYEWDASQKMPKRKSIEVAKNLLSKAGYPNGIDPKTGRPLVLNFDTVMSSGPDSQALLAWMRKQFQKLGIQLVIQATQYNRFQEKMSTGQAQIFNWGWNADYPDPENFLFLLYGPNKKVIRGGENAANYNNEAVNQLFKKMKSMPDGPERLDLIVDLLEIVRSDSPWIWGIHPKQYILKHQWIGPTKPNAISSNTIKYVELNPDMRNDLRTEWNQPILWPLAIGSGLLLLIVIPAWFQYRRKEHRGAL
ncbi:MAG: ABC transporter substrate-binding protein [Gammaproteobacteria bacterium]